MAENTAIEWADHTFNPWIGCTKVSPACDHCYAEEMMDTRYGRARWGAGEERVRTSSGNWKLPLKWNRAAESAGTRPFVFCASLADVFDNEVDELWRRDLMDLIEATPHLVWLLLTKRIGNVKKMTDPARGCHFLPANAALGATMVNQEEWDRDLPKLIEAGRDRGAMFTFASVEPMLDVIKPGDLMPGWVIVGGESGRDPRPMCPLGPQILRDRCAADGIPFMMKQWGAWAPLPSGDSLRPGDMLLHTDAFVGPGWSMRKSGKKDAGRLLDGIEHNGRPEVK